jgi:hypothetical protein
MHDASQTFLTDLCNWIDSFYLELKTTSQCTAEEACHLVALCVKKVFEELRVPRAKASNAANLPALSDRTAAYLWAMVQAHQIMSSFSVHHFRGHPSVAPVVMLHIFTTRATTSALDKTKDTLSKLAKKVDTLDKLEARLAKLEKKPWLDSQLPPGSRKRPADPLDPSQYGSVKQVLHLPSSAVRTCLLFCRQWPHWALLAASRVIHPLCIVLGSSRWQSLVHRLFPLCHLVLWPDLDPSTFRWPQVAFTFSDFDLSLAALQPIWRVTSQFIFSPSKTRWLPAGWVPHHYSLHHSQCGGPTTGQWRLHCFSPILLPEFSLPQGGRSLASFLSSKGGGKGIFATSRLCRSPLLPSRRYWR